MEPLRVSRGLGTLDAPNILGMSLGLSPPRRFDRVPSGEDPRRVVWALSGPGERADQERWTVCRAEELPGGRYQMRFEGGSPHRSDRPGSSGAGPVEARAYRAWLDKVSQPGFSGGDPVLAPEEVTLEGPAIKAPEFSPEDWEHGGEALFRCARPQMVLLHEVMNDCCDRARPRGCTEYRSLPCPEAGSVRLKTCGYSRSTISVRGPDDFEMHVRGTHVCARECRMPVACLRVFLALALDRLSRGGGLELRFGWSNLGPYEVRRWQGLLPSDADVTGLSGIPTLTLALGDFPHPFRPVELGEDGLAAAEPPEEPEEEEPELEHLVWGCVDAPNYHAMQRDVVWRPGIAGLYTGRDFDAAAGLGSRTDNDFGYNTWLYVGAGLEGHNVRLRSELHPHRYSTRGRVEAQRERESPRRRRRREEAAVLWNRAQTRARMSDPVKPSRAFDAQCAASLGARREVDYTREELAAAHNNMPRLVNDRGEFDVVLTQNQLRQLARLLVMAGSPETQGRGRENISVALSESSLSHAALIKLEGGVSRIELRRENGPLDWFCWVYGTHVCFQGVFVPARVLQLALAFFDWHLTEEVPRGASDGGASVEVAWRADRAEGSVVQAQRLCKVGLNKLASPRLTHCLEGYEDRGRLLCPRPFRPTCAPSCKHA